MEFLGRLETPTIDFTTGRIKLIIAPDMDVREGYEELKGEKLLVTIKKYRKRRSLNANAYFHVLLGKLADKMNTSKAYMKNFLLQRYGQLDLDEGSPISVVVKESVDMMEREEIHLRPTSMVLQKEGGEPYRVHFLIRGSHTYNTKEMSVLIDGTVQEAREVGIDTITPEELQKMKEAWRAEV